MSEGEPRGEAAVEPADTRSVRSWLRPVAVVGVIASLWALGRMSGLHAYVDPEAVRNAIRSSGAWGGIVFVALFTGGVLLHVPGILFVAGAMFAWGRLTGTLLSLVGGLVAVTVSFLVVRAVGGRALQDVERPLVRRMLDRLDRQPVRAVAVLRLVLWMWPGLNYVLALTSVRLPHYVLGSALGLVPPITAVALLFDWLFG